MEPSVLVYTFSLTDQRSFYFLKQFLPKQQASKEKRIKPCSILIGVNSDFRNLIQWQKKQKTWQQSDIPPFSLLSDGNRPFLLTVRTPAKYIYPSANTIIAKFIFCL